MADEAQTPEQDPGFNELREAYESDELIVFVGAGVSAGAGLPSWGRLVTMLMDRARARRVDPEILREVEALVAKDHYIDALSELSDALGPAEFGTAIERAVDDRNAQVPEAAHAIAALAPKLRAVLTTNLDHLLERAFAGRWPMFARAPGDLATRRGYILKLHGTLLERDTWVMTREQYDHAMYADPRMATTFTALFHVCPILFVGYGLVDDDFDQLLARVRVLSGPQPPRHFALVPAERVTRSWRRRIEGAGVRLIPYPNPDGKHREVARLLRLVGEERVQAGAAAPPPVRTLDDVRQMLQDLGVQDPAATRTGAAPPSPWPPPWDPLVQFLHRLLKLEGWSCTHALVNQLLAGDRGRVPFDAALAVHEDRGFVLALGYDEQLFGPTSRLPQLAEQIAARGGAVRLYALTAMASPLPGVEVVGLRDEVARYVNEPLRAHAERCLAAWTEEDERRFVVGRARLDDGSILPVTEALTGALGLLLRVILLGDFGTGKSTQLRRQAARMARTYLEDPAGHRAPLWLPLTGLEPDVPTIFAHHLPEVPVAALQLAVDLGMAVPLFDGFDELDFRGGAASSTVEAALSRLLTMSMDSQPLQVVVSTRGTAFASHRQLETIVQGLPGTTLLTLEDLDRSEVEEFVRKATTSASEAEAALRKIAEVHDLGELAQRPALLDLIVRNHERLTTGQGEPVTSVRLYEMAAEDWLGSREHEEKQLEHRQRLAFARALARALWISGEASVLYARIVGLVAEVLGEAAAVFDPSAATFEVQKAVFLTWGAEHGAFRFAHRSFLEYFLAVDVAERLDARRADALDLPLLRSDIVWFLVGIAGWDQRKEQLRAILRAPYRPRVSENALFVLYQAARLRVGADDGEALGAELARDLPRRAQLGGARLGGWNLDRVSLVDADLSRADLVDAELRGADLTGARLLGARAHHAVFDGVLFDGADVSGADLFAASLVEASVVGTRAQGTQLGQVVWLGAAPGPLVPVENGPLLPVRQTWGDHTPRDLAWSPDGRWLALAADNAVHLVDAWSGALARSLGGHSRAVLSVCFSPDGSLLASGSFDERVRVWEVASGRMLCELEGHTGPVWSVCYSPDGARVVSGSDDHSLRLWDIAGARSLRTFQGHIAEVLSVRFSPDGTRLASASEDRSVLLWDVASGKVLRVLQGHFNGVWAVRFSPDGSLVASASADRTVHLCEAASGTLLRVLEGHADVVRSLAFSPDGLLLASASYDGSVRVWDVTSGGLLPVLEGDAGPLQAVSFSPDGTLLAATSHQGSLHLWDVASGRRLRTRRWDSPGVLAVRFSRDGTQLVSASADGRLRRWNASSGQLLEARSNFSVQVQTECASPDGTLRASASGDGTIRLYRSADGRCLAILQAAADSWVCHLPDAPFFVGEDPQSRLLRLAGGGALMPASLWALLFQRPDLVAAAIAGQPPDLAALGLDSYEACAAALLRARARLGLTVRRRASTTTPP